MSRVPLSQRVNGSWTPFETKLFNLVTQEGDRKDTARMLFSRRLALVDEMLTIYDREVDMLEAREAAFRRSALHVVEGAKP